MHVRSLVRRLLGLRGILKHFAEGGLQAGDNLWRQAKSSADTGLGDAVAINNAAGKGDGEHAVHQSHLGDNFCSNRQHVAGIGDNQSIRPELNSRASRFGIGHCFPLDELNQHLAGQVSTLSSGGVK